MDTKTKDQRLYPNDFLCSANLKYQFSVTTDYVVRATASFGALRTAATTRMKWRTMPSMEAAYYDGKTCPHLLLRCNGHLVVYPDSPLLGLLSCQVHWYVDLESKPR